MKRALKWSFITSGGIPLLGPVIGLIGTVFGMVGAFDTLGSSRVANTDKLSSDIGVTLISTASGFFIGLIGLIFFMVCLIYWLCTRSTPQPPATNTAEQD